MPDSDILIVDGWALYQHPCFADQVDALKAVVEKKRKKDPAGYVHTTEAKLLAAIFRLMTVVIPTNPGDPSYRQGKTLGSEHTHWFRAKFFQQYRLFFRYDTHAKIIIYAWVNDTDTKRAYDSKTDAYAVFKRMLDDGYPPNSWQELKAQSAGIKK
jgi:toxin YhaV